MSDYINRDGLAEHKFQESELRGMGEGQAYRQGWNDAIDAIIDNEPAADVVEVVRCEKCKYYHSITARCEVRGKDLFLIRGSEDFCSRGERREDE